MMSLPEDYSGWKETIFSAMSRDESVSWFALVDPCADPRLPAMLWELEDNPGIIPLFMNTMVHEVSMNGPLFVPLTPGSHITDWILAESETIPLGCIYSVKTDEVDDLFDHLQNLLECALPNGSPGIFRFYDPRVLYVIARFPDPVWMQYVAGQAAAVYAWEPGCLTPVVYAENGLVLEEEGIAIDQALLNAVSAHTSPYAVISSMQGERGDTLRAMPLQEAYPYVKDICDSIAAMEIPYLRDFVSGTSIVMQLGENIFADDYVRQVMMSKREDETLLDAVRKIPDSFFSRHGNGIAHG